ncbi:Low-density receptor-like protein [Rhynchospora pubera]|uniref:Low-density receptor-like protein n=1 Tax=Rhynchospora pubera TaxID=906938 RepID=A0AAV8GMF1_9POAL|nr:Low-density receptor-like protein [Rhynchospora pubera]
MAIATSSATLALTSGINSNKNNVSLGGKLNGSSAYLPGLKINHKSYQVKGRRNLAVCARRDSSGGGGDFFAGFVLGGAIFGALAYYYAPQIRRVVEQENEHGFKIPKIENFSSDVYFYDDEDEGLEENVASRFKGVTSKMPVPPPPPPHKSIDDGDMKYGV